MRRFLFILSWAILLFTGCTTLSLDYGVFLGIDSDEIQKLDRYSIVVIEPSSFTSEQIQILHNEGKTVYGYLNVGAVEEYRPYYDRFNNLYLGIYEDWPDERWVNVASPSFQSFIIDSLGKEYAELGLDGFFIDNADIYYHFPEDDIYQGLCTIMKGLKRYGIPLYINGGDTFVSRCMKENIALSLFDGINQETVFTSIDFENHTYSKQDKKETEYFKDYLSKVKNYGLSVYLLEYGANHNLSKEIDAYCIENNFLWYNAKGLELR